MNTLSTEHAFLGLFSSWYVYIYMIREYFQHYIGYIGRNFGAVISTFRFPRSDHILISWT